MVNIDKKENNTVEFSLDIPTGEFEKAVQKAYLANRGKIMLPGFRKGKVPRKIIEMHYGSDVFYEDALNEILPELYDDALEELGLETVDQPHVDLPEDIEKGKDVKVVFRVDVKPEITLPSFDGFEVEDVRFEVTDEIVDDELRRAVERNARMVEIDDRAIEEEDLVNINYVGRIDGEVFEGGQDEDVDLHIGSGTFIEGFESGLIGKNVGDEVELNLVFPEDYHAADVAGKDVVFEVKVNAIRKRELPEVNDEFIKDISEFDTVDEYKEDVRKRLTEDFANQEQQQKEHLAVTTYADMVEVDIPEGMIRAQLNEELQKMDLQMNQSGLSLDQYMQFTNSTIDDLLDHLRPQAEQAVKQRLVLETIAKEQAFEITEEEIEEEIMRIADLYSNNDKELRESFIKEMKEGDQTYLNRGLENKKAMDYLVGKATFVEKAEKVQEDEAKEA